MYKIGIIGHGPEHFADKVLVQRRVDRVVDILKYQYGQEHVIFNVLGKTGVGLWAATSAIKQGCKHHIFLPYSIEQTSRHWFERQKNVLQKCCQNAYSITACYSDESFDDQSYEALIDESSFMVCFWIGKRQGSTWQAVQYAMENNKIVVNGLDELKMITKYK